jgi:hypothetical protein
LTCGQASTIIVAAPITLLPGALAACEAGNDVSFGSRLSLGPRGVCVGEDLLPWNDVAGQASAVEAPGRRSVRNAWVLMAMSDEMRRRSG